VTLQCRLSDFDRRTTQDNSQPIGLVEAQGVDFFENLCLSGENACAKDRSYQQPNLGVPNQKIAAHVRTHFYVDKELSVSIICNNNYFENYTLRWLPKLAFFQSEKVK